MNGKKKSRGPRFQVPQPKKSQYSLDFKDIYAEFFTPLTKMFFAKVRDSDDAEDLAQATLIKTWRWASDKIERGEDFYWSGLGGAIALNCTRVYCDFFAKSKRATENLFSVEDLEDFDCADDGLGDPYRILLSQRSDEAVQRFTDMLQGDWRELFIDHHYHGLSRGELSDKYHRTKGSVSTNLSRLRSDLMEYLKNYDLLPEEESVYDR